MTTKWARPVMFAIFTAFLISGGQSCNDAPQQNDRADECWQMDSRSYQLGVIAAFSEIVAAGVKKLALSAPLTPEEMAGLLPESKRIAEENGVLLYLEKDFCVTDLFPEDITAGKHVLLIYCDPVKEEYLALKREKDELVKTGRYRGEARRNIARKMGRLLSYPEAHIEKLLRKDKS
ncbi:MAG: hypothetical protein PVH84_11165 [Candidatus Aminicenantes bacterium]